MFLKNNYCYTSVNPNCHCQMCGKLMVSDSDCESYECLCENCKNIL